MISICFVHFKSLTLANLKAALLSVRAQDLSKVRELIFVDNDSRTNAKNINEAFEELSFPFSVHFSFFAHDDPLKTHSWSSNRTVSLASQPWVLFTRSDYLLDPTTVQKFSDIAFARSEAWDGFITASGCHLPIDIEECERAGWREYGLQRLKTIGASYDYTCIDAGVWMARRETFNRVGGLDERLSAWGHAQTHFQWKLHKTGVEFVRVPEVLFYHPAHGGEKDLNLAHKQLASLGIDIRELWARYEGPRMY